MRAPAALLRRVLGLTLNPIMGTIGWGGPSPALPFCLLQQWCLRVGVSRCWPAAVVGRGC